MNVYKIFYPFWNTDLSRWLPVWKSWLPPTAYRCVAAWLTLPVGSLTFGFCVHLPALSPILPVLWPHRNVTWTYQAHLSPLPSYLLCLFLLSLVDFLLILQDSRRYHLTCESSLTSLDRMNCDIRLGSYSSISAEPFESLCVYPFVSKMGFTTCGPWQVTWVPQSHRVKMVYLPGLAILLKDLGGNLYFKTSRIVLWRIHVHVNCKDSFLVLQRALCAVPMFLVFCLQGFFTHG